MSKISPDPPPPKKKITFIEQNDFVMQQNKQDPHILDQSYAFCSHPDCKRSYKRPKCALIAYRSRNISHGLLLHPVLGHSDAFNLYKLSSSFMNIVQEALIISSRARSSEICLYNQYSSIKEFVNYHVYFVSFMHLEWISWTSSLSCL